MGLVVENFSSIATVLELNLYTLPLTDRPMVDFIKKYVWSFYINSYGARQLYALHHQVYVNSLKIFIKSTTGS